MTASIGAFKYQSIRGANRLASHVGMAFAMSQKKGASAPTMA